MNLSPGSNAPGLVRVGLIALFCSVAFPVLRFATWGSFDTTSGVATILFRSGVFCVALGVAIRSGWLAGARKENSSRGAVTQER